MRRSQFVVALFLICIVAVSIGPATAANLSEGTPDLKSAGPLAFGPDGVLFVADPQGAAIFAIDTGDNSGTPSRIDVEGVGAKVAAMLGTTEREVMINDLAVNPSSGNVYLSVSRGRGPDAKPVLIRIDSDGNTSEFELANVKFAKAALPNAPDPSAKDRRNRSLRTQSITDLGYVDGQVFIAGLSNEEFASTLRSIPFPFSDVNKGAGVRIFHGAHGRFETGSPVRTFTQYKIAGEPHLLAAYTCTPLVKFPVSALKPGEKVQGTTIAELGNRNNPLDMVVYEQGGKDYVLIANTSRGVMKVTTDNIEGIEGITEKIGGTAGLKYETIDSLQGVTQLDRLDDKNAVILVQNDSGEQNLQTIALP